ncbi:MAG: hypothetical protein LBD23_01220 [Oscillospiraceae bacterium]|jgi:DNA segregation ATPase FtsK/SpoIIIE-like protein|nr:hypothetical protein [Oscillospiraceae bacterium]
MDGIPIVLNRSLAEKGIVYPIPLNLSKTPQMLIIGATGSCKTYAQRLILGKIVKYVPDVELIICDYKNEDFRDFEGLPRHYGYENCINGLNDFYASFQRRLNREDYSNSTRVLLFDEWGAFVVSRDKKVSDDMKSKLSALLMLGRSYRTHIIIGLQRADSEHFKAGARDQFGAILALGNLSKKQKQMLFTEHKDEIINDCGRGTGYFLRDGQGIKRCIVPVVRDMEKLNQTIINGLSR